MHKIINRYVIFWFINRQVKTCYLFYNSADDFIAVANKTVYSGVKIEF